MRRRVLRSMKHNYIGILSGDFVIDFLICGGINIEMQKTNFLRFNQLLTCAIILILISFAYSSPDYKKVCQGTSGGLNHIDWTIERYNFLYNRYINCTHVDGNLELVFIEDPIADLLFLSTIKEVSGYVLIAISYAEFIPLTSLRVIRGRTLFHEKDAGLSNYYSLFVYLNFDPEDSLNVGLKELQLNSLHEIQSGSVFVQHNNRLCYGNNILWRDIVTGESGLIITSEQYHSKHPHVKCESCHESCDFNGIRYCWGRGSENCQKLNRETCSKQCGGQCFGSLPNQCCHSECIGGCVGPSESQCWACKNFDDNGICLKFCPPEFVYDPALFKQVPNPNFKFSYGTLCVDKCPEHLNSRQGACVQECGKGMIADKDRKCTECNGTCPKECKFDFPHVNSYNILIFKDCTIVHGSIFIPSMSFRKDKFLDLPPLNVTNLFYLKDIKEVSGFVKIQANIPQLRNLYFLSNLQIIHGMKLDSIRASLHIHKTKLEVLGLNSLKEIRNGGVLISGNNKLCYAESIKWNNISKLNVIVKENSLTCEQEKKICHAECSDDGCWGQGDNQCLSCKNFQLVSESHIKRCVLSCSAQQGIFQSAPRECRTCHEECSYNCHGPNSGQCDSCKRAKDGPYCVSECPKGKFLDEYGLCRECHLNCNDDGCTGPLDFQDPQGCRTCKLPLYKWRDSGTSLLPNITNCLSPRSDCPSGYFMRPFKPACIECHPLCRECLGPTLEECISCQSVRLESRCLSECPSNHFVTMGSSRNMFAKQDVSLNLNSGIAALEPICMPCDLNCLKCNGPSNKNCSLCKQYKVFVNDSLGDSFIKNFYCSERCPEDKPESVLINSETICQPFDYAARGRMIASISLVVLISIIISVIVALVFCLKKQKAQNDIKKAKETLSLANNKEEMSPATNKCPDMSNLIIIKSSELKIGTLIGSGAYGKVHKGIWRPVGLSPTEVAIKILKENSQELLDEARIMASVDHDCCIKILCVSLSAELMLITPLMKLGCLLYYVRSNSSNISSKEIILWSKQIALGMDHLESRGIVHCDLAARNVLVDSVKQVKITDFGLAKLHLWKELQLMSSENEVSIKMPIKWLAPESLKSREFTHKSDVWSYGVTVWELCTFGDRPYKFISNFRDVIGFLEAGARLEKPGICSHSFYNQILQCWHWDPESRPSFSELVKTIGSMLSSHQLFMHIMPEHRQPQIYHQSTNPTLVDLHHQQKKPSNAIDYLTPEPPILYKNLLLLKKQTNPVMSSHMDMHTKKDTEELQMLSELTELSYVPNMSDFSHSYKNDFTPGFLDRPIYSSHTTYVNGSFTPTMLQYPLKTDVYIKNNFILPTYSEHEYYNELEF